MRYRLRGWEKKEDPKGWGEKLHYLTPNVSDVAQNLITQLG